MEAKELRYKNWVSFKGNPCQINNIHGSSGLAHVLPTEDVNVATRSIYDFKPIPLDEGWLEILGFERLSNYSWRKVNSEMNSQIVLSTAGNGFHTTAALTQKPINYVHKLQNLWQILMDEELEVKSIA